MISTVIIVLVCVAIIAIIYYTLVKGEVCVCVCGWCCTVPVFVTGKINSTGLSATSLSATGNSEMFGKMISTDTNPSYSGVQYNSGVGTLATPEYVTII